MGANWGEFNQFNVSLEKNAVEKTKNCSGKCTFEAVKFLEMVLTISILILLLVAAIYIAGSFMPVSVAMRLIEVEQNIDQCFAAANHPQYYEKAIGSIQQLTFSSTSPLTVRTTGKVNFGTGEKSFEVTAYVPNYRITVEQRNGGEICTVELSFYRLSRKSTRLAVITRVESSSPLGRFKNAIGSKKRAAQIDNMLEEAKGFLENFAEPLETVADVSPDENPNFSLR